MMRVHKIFLTHSNIFSLFFYRLFFLSQKQHFLFWEKKTGFYSFYVQMKQYRLIMTNTKQYIIESISLSQSKSRRL